MELPTIVDRSYARSIPMQFLYRMICFALVPCLITDPASAAIFAGAARSPSSSNGSVYPASFFTAQAMADAATQELHALSHGGVIAMERAGEVALDRTPQAVTEAA